MDVRCWEEKQKKLLEKLEEIYPKGLNQVIEEGQDTKLVFQDSSWLGFHYNERESSLFLYHDAESGQKAEKC